MEYCPEGDLFNYLKKNRKKLPVPETLFIFRQIVDAFILLNIKGVMHRDLKPENIFLSNNLTIKIGDFGCARSINIH